MIPLEVAQQEVLALAAPLPPQQLPLPEALGLVLAEEVLAAERVPHFDCSAMDGYALRAADVAGAPVRLAVVGTTLAGDPPAPGIGEGQAVRIMTGAPLPPGADAVCMQEETEPGPDGRAVLVLRAQAPGQHLRRAGEDLELGQLVAAPGTMLGPRHLGALASVGIARLRVHPRPRVGVLSTGSELRSLEERLGPGQIRDSNRYVLLALAARAGATPVDLGVVADDEELAAAALEAAAASCDVVVTSGGVSVGEKDVVKALLARCCGSSGRSRQVAIKPAKPLAFGRLRWGAPLVGLPGNPVSSAVAFECFVRPLLRALAGHPHPLVPHLAARAAEALPRQPDGRLHLVPVALEATPEGGLQVRRAGGDGSHLLASTLASDALALLPDGPGVAAGALLEVLPLSGAGAPRPAPTG